MCAIPRAQLRAMDPSGAESRLDVASIDLQVDRLLDVRWGLRCSARAALTWMVLGYFSAFYCAALFVLDSRSVCCTLDIGVG